MEIYNNGGCVSGVSYQRYGTFKCWHPGADLSDLGKPLFPWIQVE
jgi:hypothetical protein